MMRLVHLDWNFNIEIENNYINSIIIEDKSLFRKVLVELTEQVSGNEGKFVLSEDYSEISIGKYLDIVSDILFVDPNDKKIKNKIILELIKEANNEVLSLNKVKTELNLFFNKFSNEGMFELDRDEDIDLSSLMKLGKFYIDCDNKNIIDRLITYMLAMREYGKINIFLVVNLSSFVTNEEKRMLFDSIVMNKINLICLESFIDEELDLCCEKRYIIDKDFCEI